MNTINITVGPFNFKAAWENENAPVTCQKFKDLLPFDNQVVHSRWSGEAVWVPMGDFDMDLEFENHTSHPSKGNILLYPGGYSETEILFVYGSSQFASKMGQLAGNHFLTVTEGQNELAEMGKMILWEGKQDIRFFI